MTTCLITGGCGFIGVNLVAQVLRRGHRVRVLDNLSTGIREDLDARVELQIGDIRDCSAVSKACQSVDTVVHLAAHTRVVESISDPDLNFAINATGTLNVLKACRDAGVRKVIFASTGGAILGEQEPPVHEAMVPRPISPYGASKLAGEGYCSAFFGSFGLNTVALRFSNVYGPWSYHKGSVVAQFIRRLMRNEPIVIYGDGQQTRDFLYVADLVDAILLADEIETPGEVFQVASGRETSVLALVEAMKRVLPDREFQVRFEAPRAGEIFRNYASIEKARRMLGYDPKTNLEDGLRATLQWFVSRGGVSAAG
jgi:UDP-glucose 4-epimerase